MIMYNSYIVGEIFDFWAKKPFKIPSRLPVEALPDSSAEFPMEVDKHLLELQYESKYSTGTSTMPRNLPEFEPVIYKVGRRYMVYRGFPSLNEITESRESRLAKIILIKDYLKAINKIIQFSNLKYNWDSYGSQPINRNCILTAARLILEIISWRDKFKLEVPVPFLVPTHEGGLQFEWKIENRYLEIEIITGKPIEYFATDREYELEGIIETEDDLRELIQWIVYCRADSLNRFFAKIARKKT